MKAGRALFVAASVLLVGALACWLAALVTASRPRPPALVVYAERHAGTGGVLPVYVQAVDLDKRRKVSFEGSARIAGGAAALVEDGVARPVLPAAMGSAPVVVEGRADGLDVELAFDVAVKERWPSGPAPVFAPWTRELQERTLASLSGPAVYPLAGSARSSLPTRVLLLDDAGARLEELAAHAAVARTSDGRALRLDRSGLLVEVPPSSPAGARVPVRITAARAADLLAVLLVDGRVRDMRQLAVPAGTSEHAFGLPEDAPAGALYALRVSPTASGALGALGVGLVGPSGPPSARVEEMRRRPPFQGLQDPLLEALVSGRVPASEEAVRALLARVELPGAGPARVGPDGAAQAAAADARRQAEASRFRAPFRVLGLLFAGLSGGVALAFTRRRAALSRALAEESGAVGGGGARTRALLSWLWAALGLAVALGLLAVMDLALGFVIAGAPAA